ncbi:MAG: hypothetical protein GY793_00110 [Proteobacteria bacterium]|nr:hypothetical protein [Pseudomonadota bacterium]
MNRKQFRNSNREVPTKPGKYQWKMQPRVFIPVIWKDKKWFTISGDSLGKAVVFWR